MKVVLCVGNYPGDDPGNYHLASQYIYKNLRIAICRSLLRVDPLTKYIMACRGGI